MEYYTAGPGGLELVLVRWYVGCARRNVVFFNYIHEGCGLFKLIMIACPVLNNYNNNNGVSCLAGIGPAKTGEPVLVCRPCTDVGGVHYTSWRRNGN